MKNTIFLFALTLLLVACNSKSDNQATDNTSNAPSENTVSSKSYDCLEDYLEKYDELLSQADITSVYSDPLDDVKEKLSGGNYGEHILSWNSDRPMQTISVAGREMEFNDMNRIGVENLSFLKKDADLVSARETFDFGYRPLSPEQIANLEERVAAAAEDDNVKDVGLSALQARAKFHYEFVDNLGTSAWYQWTGSEGGELVIMAGRAKFAILTKVSNDPNENKDLAVKLAKIVLSKCD